MSLVLPVRVVKVGGSLLDWPQLPAALGEWLNLQPAATTILIAGGGQFVDVVRRADGAYGIGEEAAHWLCVDLLSVTARLLAEITHYPLIRATSELVFSGAAICVLDPATFLRDAEPQLGTPTLPQSWAVTSDSIAARMTQALRADELVLLKSCLPPAGSDVTSASEAGYVDACFPAAAASLPLVRCVNLRSSQFKEVAWRSPH